MADPLVLINAFEVPGDKARAVRRGLGEYA
jgi:hypothetical protein